MRGTGYDAIKHGAGAFEGKQTCCILNPFFLSFFLQTFIVQTFMKVDLMMQWAIKHQYP